MVLETGKSTRIVLASAWHLVWGSLLHYGGGHQTVSVPAGSGLLSLKATNVIMKAPPS
jgi:hypothetical protein